MNKWWKWSKLTRNKSSHIYTFHLIELTFNHLFQQQYGLFYNPDSNEIRFRYPSFPSKWFFRVQNLAFIWFPFCWTSTFISIFKNFQRNRGQFMFSFKFWSSSLKNLAIQWEQQYSNGHGQNANTSSTMFIGNGSTIRSSNENCHLMPGHVSFYCIHNKKMSS